MIKFVAGISPSLNTHVCNYVFEKMLVNNDIINQFIVSNSDEIDKVFLSDFVGIIQMEFVTPEQIIVA